MSRDRGRRGGASIESTGMRPKSRCLIAAGVIPWGSVMRACGGPAALVAALAFAASACTGVGPSGPSEPTAAPSTVPTATAVSTGVPTTASSGASSLAPTPAWLPKDLGEPGGLVDVVAAGPGLVAVGYRSWETPTQSTVWTSPDGVTWTEVPAPGDFDLGRMTSVASGSNGLVAVGRPSEGARVGASFWVSRDGFAWAAVHDPRGFENRDMTSIVAWRGRYFAGGSLNRGRPGVVSSNDGLAWVTSWEDPVKAGTQGSSRAATSVSALGIYAGGLAAAVDEFTGVSIRYSNDGAAWRTGDALQDADDVRALAPWADGLLAVGRDSSGHGAIWLSLDGTSWRRVADLGPGEALDVAVNGGRALVSAYGADGVPQLLDSRDGERWTPAALSPGVAAWTLPLALTPFGDGFIGVGSVGDATVDSVRLAVWRETADTR